MGKIPENEALVLSPSRERSVVPGPARLIVRVAGGELGLVIGIAAVAALAVGGEEGAEADPKERQDERPKDEQQQAQDNSVLIIFKT